MLAWPWTKPLPRQTTPAIQTSQQLNWRFLDTQATESDTSRAGKERRVWSEVWLQWNRSLLEAATSKEAYQFPQFWFFQTFFSMPWSQTSWLAWASSVRERRRKRYISLLCKKTELLLRSSYQQGPYVKHHYSYQPILEQEVDRWFV